ncbi:MAG: apolipoprotein N-acyltransferase [Geminicoccaceae bacterium]|nr:apolipoprotein N-acyltransferase [Geminicoccaceae bacterium]
MGFLPGLLGLAALAVLLAGAGARGEGFWTAYAHALLFLYAYFLLGLYWVGIAFYADAERFGALAVPGVLALAAILTFLQALPLGLMGLRRWQSPFAAGLAFAVLWLMGEALRGFLTQFPWNPIVLVWALSDATMQPIAWIGGRGLGLLTLAGAALLGLFWRTGAPRPAAASLLLLLVPAGLGLLRLQGTDPGTDPAVPLRIVQAKVAQAAKWDPEKRRAWLKLHMDLTAGPPAFPWRLAVWPESSIPYRLDPDPEGRRFITGVLPKNGYLVAGADHYDPGRTPPVLHNSVYALDPKGDILARYDKVNLVPFGEFLPFRRIFGAIGLEALAVGSIDFQPGAGRTTVTLPGIPPFSPLVCYEAAFEGRATDGTGRARWLLNVTNDAWFGESTGPYQHLAMARMRAVETGLPLVRAANSGVSVVTDAYGRIKARLGLGERGVLDVLLPRPLPPPPASRWPYLPWLLVALAGLVAAVVEARRHAGRS